MTWEIIQRDDNFEGTDVPFISISHERFLFSAIFVKIAELNLNKRFTVHADVNNFKLGFQFHEDDRPNSFGLYLLRSGTKGMNSSAKSIVRKFAWINSITRLAPKHRRFEPKLENSPVGKIWSIQLHPAFEEKRARESMDIPSNARGIYRYVRESGEVVYIGRGDINSRLRSPDRQTWEFDTIEYSVVADPDQQVHWETYWLDIHKADHGGKLPFYNKVSGASSAED